MIEINSHSIISRLHALRKSRFKYKNSGATVHRRPVYMYSLNVPSFSSRYFNKIKRTSRLGRLLALSLEILSHQRHSVVFAQMYQFSMNLSSLQQKIRLRSTYLGTNTIVVKRVDCTCTLSKKKTVLKINFCLAIILMGCLPDAL